MKLTELKKLTKKQLDDKLNESKLELMKLNAKKALKTIEKPSQVKNTRKLVARIKTLLREKFIKASKKNAVAAKTAKKSTVKTAAKPSSATKKKMKAATAKKKVSATKKTVKKTVKKRTKNVRKKTVKKTTRKATKAVPKAKANKSAKNSRLC